jgi:hypothetical protein
MRQWTLEERARQAALIKTWKPWDHSTGPNTPEGKEACKMNAEKHGMRGCRWQVLRQLLRGQRDFLKEFQV